MKVRNPSWAIFVRGVLAAGIAGLLVACTAPAAPTEKSPGAGANESPAAGPEQKQKKPPAQAARPNEGEAVKARMKELLDLCQSGKTDEAAGYFVYRGPDKSREWKDTLRANDPEEKAGAAELCRRVNNYLDESRSYQLGRVRVKRESEGEWHGLDVSFQKDGRARKALFAFLKIKGEFAVGDIDD